MGHEYVAEVEKHSSQTDAARGFGGKYGVEKDRADKVSISLCHPAQILWDLPALTVECGSMLLLWKDGSGLRRVHHEDSSHNLLQQVPLCHFWRPHAELNSVNINDTKILKLCFDKESNIDKEVKPLISSLS